MTARLLRRLIRAWVTLPITFKPNPVNLLKLVPGLPEQGVVTFVGHAMRFIAGHSVAPTFECFEPHAAGRLIGIVPKNTFI